MLCEQTIAHGCDAEACSFARTLCAIHELQWMTIDIYDFHEYQWMTIDIYDYHEYQWITEDIHDFHGYQTGIARVPSSPHDARVCHIAFNAAQLSWIKGPSFLLPN